MAEKPEDPRIQRLLLQLEDPELDDDDIQRIKSKISYIEARQSA